MSEQPLTNPGDTVLKGLGLLLLLHLLQIPMSFFTVGISVFLIGVTQVVYVVPAAIISWKHGNRNVSKGVMIGAGITVLLNATCTAIVFGSLGNMH
jgi:hypothetical protein